MFWWRRKEREQDLERELRSHLELEAEELGDPHAARRALGNQTRIMEDVRSSWGWTGLEQVFEDLRYALLGHFRDYLAHLRVYGFVVGCSRHHEAQIKNSQQSRIGLHIESIIRR